MNDYFVDVPLMIVKNQLEAEEKLKDYSVLEHLPNEDFCRPYLVLWGIDAERYKSGELSVSELGEKKLTELYYKNHTPIKRVPAKQRRGLYSLNYKRKILLKSYYSRVRLATAIQKRDLARHKFKKTTWIWEQRKK